MPKSIQEKLEEIFESFALDGKITEQHAKAIKEIMGSRFSKLLDEVVEKILLKEKDSLNGDGLPFETKPDVYGNARIESFKNGYNSAVQDFKARYKGLSALS